MASLPSLRCYLLKVPLLLSTWQTDHQAFPGLWGWGGGMHGRKQEASARWGQSLLTC